MDENVSVPGGLWDQLERAEMIPELQKAMGEVIRRIICDPSAHPLSDLVLERCGTRPIFFEQGMSIVMFASSLARETFRTRLVECGEFAKAIRLGDLMNRPLSRDELVKMGNNNNIRYVDEEACKFLAYVERTEGILPLDRRRLIKQLLEKKHV